MKFPLERIQDLEPQEIEIHDAIVFIKNTSSYIQVQSRLKDYLSILNPQFKSVFIDSIKTLSNSVKSKLETYSLEDFKEGINYSCNIALSEFLSEFPQDSDPTLKNKLDTMLDKFVNSHAILIARDKRAQNILNELSKKDSLTPPES